MKIRVTREYKSDIIDVDENSSLFLETLRDGSDDDIPEVKDISNTVLHSILTDSIRSEINNMYSFLLMERRLRMVHLRVEGCDTIIDHITPICVDSKSLILGILKRMDDEFKEKTDSTLQELYLKSDNGVIGNYGVKITIREFDPFCGTNIS